MTTRRTHDQISADVAREHAEKVKRNNETIDAMIDGRHARIDAIIGDADHSAARNMRDAARDGQHYATACMTDAAKPEPVAVTAAQMRDLARTNQF